MLKPRLILVFLSITGILFSCSAEQEPLKYYSIIPLNHWEIIIPWIQRPAKEGILLDIGPDQTIYQYYYPYGGNVIKEYNFKGEMIRAVNKDWPLGEHVETVPDSFMADEKSNLYILFGSYWNKCDASGKIIWKKSILSNHNKNRKFDSMIYYGGLSRIELTTDGNIIGKYYYKSHRGAEDSGMLYLKISPEGEVIGEVPGLFCDADRTFYISEAADKNYSFEGHDEYKFYILNKRGEKILIGSGKKAQWCRVGRKIYLLRKAEDGVYCLEQYNSKGNKIKQIDIRNIKCPPDQYIPDDLPVISPYGYFYTYGRKTLKEMWVNIWQIKIPD